MNTETISDADLVAGDIFRFECANVWFMMVDGGGIIRLSGENYSRYSDTVKWPQLRVVRLKNPQEMLKNALFCES